MVLFINAVDELLSEKGLGFVTNIINIAFIVLLAILITKGVRRLMQRLRSSRRISDDPVKQKRAETAETLMASIYKIRNVFYSGGAYCKRARLRRKRKIAACGGGDRRHSNRHRRAKPYFGHCERVLLFV